VIATIKLGSFLRDICRRRRLNPAVINLPRPTLALAAAWGLFSVVTAADKTPPPLSGPESDGPFRKVILDSDHDTDGDGRIDDTLIDVMEIAVAGDGRVFLIERAGVVKVLDPSIGAHAVAIGKLDVFSGLEDGLLGLALDPGFLTNHWIYLMYSDPVTHTDAAGLKSGENRVARFTISDGRLDLSSEKILLRVATQRDDCCHSAGSLAFDAAGNLYASTGDNTHPYGDSGSYGPLDERDGRQVFNSLKSAANANDLRGKILRITPRPDGTASIPTGNLFPPGTAKTRPEIYVMGCRNPFRISVDRHTGILYWGEVGPDAGGPNPLRGPAGFDEINQAKRAGNFGWPMFAGDNRPYMNWDFASGKTNFLYDPEHPRNTSRYNTGPVELPPAQPAFIWYPYGASSRFPAVNGGSGGRTAMAGPVYYFDPKLASPHKLPREFDHTLFIYEWTRNWIVAVHLDAREQIARKADGSLAMERFCPTMTFRRPMDMELGPDGCLYVLENGTAWQGNRDTQLVRLEYHAAGQ
jgi:cytochrome c